MDWAMKRILFIISFLFTISSIHANPTQYIATVHHSSQEYKLAKRGTQEGRFIGDIKYNNTVNENGEVTISLCDITRDLFGQVPSLVLFDFDKSAGVDNIASAELKAKLQANVNIDGCLVFFFNPCCKTFGLKIELDEPVVLSATGSIEVDIEAFSLDINVGSNNIQFNPLNNINLTGFSPVIGAWNLPPILDQFITISDQKFCANLGLPGTTLGLDFCVVLNNFTAGINGINVCPRLTISLGPQTLFDVSYTSLVPGKANLSECLTLSFFPTCSYNGASVSPDILQLFKSADSDNNNIMTQTEMSRATALLGSNANTASFNKMDADRDGQVTFSEFQTYATAQAASFDADKSSNTHKTYSGGAVAGAIIGTMLCTTLVIFVALLAFAQYKGIIALSLKQRPRLLSDYTQ